MEIYKKIDALHQKLGSKIQEFEGGAGFPLSYSDRLSEEINLLINGCGLFDLKVCWLIAIKGTDAGNFLQGLVTSDVLKLEIGKIQSSLICDNKGKILHHIKIFRTYEKEWIVICDPGEGKLIGKIIDNFHVLEKLELRLLNKSEMLRLDLIGPNSLRNLEKIGFSKNKLNWVFKKQNIFSAQFNLGNTFRVINLVPLNIFQIFIEEIINNEKTNFVSLRSFDEIRALEGIPRIGVDYKIGNFPQESALGDHISYQKGCYIGQETHARMFHRGHANWLSVWLSIPENIKTSIGDKLFSNAKEVGLITSLGSFSKNGFFKGIGMIRYEFAEEQIFLSLKDEKSKIIKQKSLPFSIKK